MGEHVVTMALLIVEEHVFTILNDQGYICPVGLHVNSEKKVGHGASGPEFWANKQHANCWFCLVFTVSFHGSFSYDKVFLLQSYYNCNGINVVSFWFNLYTVAKQKLSMCRKIYFFSKHENLKCIEYWWCFKGCINAKAWTLNIIHTKNSSLNCVNTLIYIFLNSKGMAQDWFRLVLRELKGLWCSWSLDLATQCTPLHTTLLL